MNISKRPALVLLSSVFLLSSLSLAAQDNSVVPGGRVASVPLSATRAQVRKTLGKPARTTRWPAGLIKDSWIGPEQSDPEQPQTFFHVLYKKDRVVQIEFNDPKFITREGISSDSSLAKFRAQYKRPRVRAYGYDDGEGSGYVGYYYDDVQRGITFMLITQDRFDAQAVPDSLCIHPAGRPVIPNPGGKFHRPTDEMAAPRDPAPATFDQHAKRTRPDQAPEEIEQVVRQFWDGLGRFDADKIKQSLDWPVTIVEASATGSREALVFRNPSEFDEEFKRTPAETLAKGKSEFFGTKLSGFEVRHLGADLVSVSYQYRLPSDLVARNPGRAAGLFNAVTFLRRDTKTGKPWKIMFITVPK